MSFLNRSVLQERAAAATVEKHPLLKECDVPPNVKQAYLQGCVLAVLERDDGKVTDAARQGIVHLGLSLELAESEIDEAIGVVSGLTSSKDQSDFLRELTATLSTGVYPRFFMADFEQLIKKDGVMSADAAETVDYIGRTLAQDKSWRTTLRTLKENDGGGGPVISSGGNLDSFYDDLYKYVNTLGDKWIDEKGEMFSYDNVDALRPFFERHKGCGAEEAQYACVRFWQEFYEVGRKDVSVLSEHIGIAACFMYGCIALKKGDGYKPGYGAEVRAITNKASKVSGCFSDCYMSEDCKKNCRLKGIEQWIINIDGIKELAVAVRRIAKKLLDVELEDYAWETECFEKILAEGQRCEQLLLDCMGGSDDAETDPHVDCDQDQRDDNETVGDVRDDFLSTVSNVRVGCGTLRDYANLSNECGKIAVRIIKPKNAWMIRSALDEAALYYVSYGDKLFYVSKEETGAELVRQGHAYLNGDGVPVDQGKAFRSFEQAAEMGDAEGMNMIGMCYLNGWGVAVNERNAFQYCKKSADLGFSYAQYNVGSFYQNGQGCVVDNVAAVKMYRAAATQGMPDAQNALGMCYLNGIGVKQSFREAAVWCRRAAKQDHPIAAWNMATFYMNGQGVQQDEEQARKWLRKAAKFGNEDAKKALQDLEAQSQQRSSRVPQRGAIEGFWQENGDSITNGLKVAGNLLLRGLFGG